MPKYCSLNISEAYNDINFIIYFKTSTLPFKSDWESMQSSKTELKLRSKTLFNLLKLIQWSNLKKIESINEKNNSKQKNKW